VTGFLKGGLLCTSNLPTLALNIFGCVIAIKGGFGGGGGVLKHLSLSYKLS